MVITEVEKRLHQLDPKYLQDLANFIDYLLFIQEKQSVTNGKPQINTVTESTAETLQVAEEDIPERLRVLQKFAGTARYPDYPTSKYDVYDQ